MGAGQGGIPAAGRGYDGSCSRGCDGARFARVWRRWLFGVTEVGWSFVVRVGSCLRRGEGKGVLE